MTIEKKTFLRHLALAAIGASLAAGILRAQISSALVARGDERLYRAAPAAALPYYGRAIAVDGDDVDAVDRYAFAATLARDRQALQNAVASTSRVLRLHPANDAVRVDRAFALRMLRQFPQAQRDFTIAGERRRDPRLLALAGYAAARAGDWSAARRLWRRSLEIDPSFRPSAEALRKR